MSRKSLVPPGFSGFVILYPNQLKRLTRLQRFKDFYVETRINEDVIPFAIKRTAFLSNIDRLGDHPVLVQVYRECICIGMNTVKDFRDMPGIIDLT